MKQALCITLLLFFAGMIHAELIYDNSNSSGFVFSPGAGKEILDFGISSGGIVEKFSVGYTNSSSTPSWMRITFYENPQLNNYQPGTYLKSFLIENITVTSGIQIYDYVLSEEEKFELTNGYFSYAVETSSNSTSLAIASGGNGQANEMWEYDDSFFEPGWYPFNFGGSPWAGIYMQVDTVPEPATVVLLALGGLALRRRKQ